MKNAIVVDANDVKGILVQHFGVKPDNVIKSQYSYTYQKNLHITNNS